MSEKRNYQRELDLLLQSFDPLNKPKLLLHSCCAPCSSYTLSYLSNFFHINLFYFNPNISPQSEYEKRVEEQKHFLNDYPFSEKIELIEGDYQPNLFLEMAKGMENLPEGGKRCYACYEMRLRETAKLAKELSMDYFTTTLSISPYKNAQWLNEIGERLADEYGVCYLPSDFKKKNGYRQSIALSKEYRLYRQNYCGCIFSKRERDLYEKNH